MTSLLWTQPTVVTTAASRFQSSTAVAAETTTTTSTTSLVGGLRIQEMKQENKHINVVRYEHKNRTWTVHHVDFYSEMLAIGFLDGGFLPGDVVLSWMPEHWSETVRVFIF